MITERELDERGSAATVVLRSSATRGLDAEDMLGRLRQSARRRAVARGLTAALVVVLVLGLTWSVSLRDPTTAGVPATGGSRSLVPDGGTQTADSADGPCERPDLECLGDRRLRALTARPLTFTVPPTFWLDAVVGPESFEVYRNDTELTGVTVLQGAIPVRYDDSWRRDRSAGTSAAQMAQWLAARPFLRSAHVSPRTVAGRRAWDVTGVLRRHAELPAAKPGDAPVAPTFRAGSVRAGVAPGLRGAFTLVDQAGGGVTVIWSWTHTRHPERLAGNVAMVTAILAG